MSEMREVQDLELKVAQSFWRGFHWGFLYAAIAGYAANNLLGLWPSS